MFVVKIVNQSVWKKDIKKIPSHIYEKIRKKIVTLDKFPDQGDISHLSNHHLAKYRLRIGVYRVLFDVDFDNQIVLLYRVLHRSKSYMI